MSARRAPAKAEGGQRLVVVSNRLPMTLRRTRDGWRAELLRSADGLRWESVSIIHERDRPNEAALRMREDGSLQAVIRAETAIAGTLVAEAAPPFTNWSVRREPSIVQSPVLVELEGTVYVAGRTFEGDRSDPKAPCIRQGHHSVHFGHSMLLRACSSPLWICKPVRESRRRDLAGCRRSSPFPKNLGFPYGLD